METKDFNNELFSPEEILSPFETIKKTDAVGRDTLSPKATYWDSPMPRVK